MIEIEEGLEVMIEGEGLEVMIEVLEIEEGLGKDIDVDLVLEIDIEDVQDHLGEGKHRRREQRMRSGRKWRN